MPLRLYAKVSSQGDWVTGEAGTPSGAGIVNSFVHNAPPFVEYQNRSVLERRVKTGLAPGARERRDHNLSRVRWIDGNARLRIEELIRLLQLLVRVADHHISQKETRECCRVFSAVIRRFCCFRRRVAPELKTRSNKLRYPPPLADDMAWTCLRHEFSLLRAQRL